LNIKSNAQWWRWLRDVKPRHLPFLVRALLRTQRMMDPQYYLAEHRLSGDSGRSIAGCPASANPS
jgi:hypothetical protein